MRIGIICPYSLTVPGGVQMQVLGLARALSRSGHPTRVLGPCDGPPPDPNVTPLGNSLPTIANGSIAPVAPDPSCQLRAIRAMRDESFDVIHLHEPLAPGPTMTALLVRPAPLIGTFHAAGGSLAYDFLPRATRFLAGRLDLRVAVSPDAATWRATLWAAATTCSTTAWSWPRTGSPSRYGAPVRRSCSSVATSPARDSAF